MKIATVVALALLTTGALVAAPSTQAAIQHYELNIPRQPLDGALKDLARQTGLQVALFSDTIDSNAVVGPVKGSRTPQQALETLLAKAGLTYKIVGDNTVAIFNPKDSQATGARPDSSQLSNGAPETSVTHSSEHLRLAQEDTAASGGTLDRRPPDSTERKKALDLQEVVVTGTRLNETAADGPVPVNVYSREDIERSGQSTVSDFLNTLSEVSTASPEGSRVFAGQTTVQLRGLPQGTTLVLVNGRRVENSGGTAYYSGYFDLNNIPAAAVERIEIVPEGSSAIYGSDALAGVVNIILKKNFDGFQADARYGKAVGIDDKSADLAWGKQWSRGSFSIIGSYYTRGELSGTERAILSSTAYPTVVDRCNPGNVYSTDGSNLPGLGAPSAAIRPGISGTPTTSDFNAGAANSCRQYVDASAIPHTNRASVFASGSFQLAANVELFAELMYSHNTQEQVNGHVQLLQQLLPASNAFNPFGEDVQVSYRFNVPEAQQDYDSRSNFWRPLVGARGKWSDSWDWELAAWESRDVTHYDETAAFTNDTNLQAALSSSNPQTALNLFASGAPVSSAVLRSIYSTDQIQTIGDNKNVNGFVRGTVYELPTGPIKVVLGSEYVHETLDWSDPDSQLQTFSYARNQASAFGELRIPLWSGPGSGDTKREVLAFTGALRYDHYNDFGGRATPQYALEWRPLDTLLVRGSYAKAFSAPPLVDVYTPRTLYPPYCCVNDPLHGGQSVPAAFYFGGDPTLQPQTGHSKSIGVVWSPNGTLGGLQAALTYWRVDQENRVSALALQALVDDAAQFPGRIVRDPVTGAIQSIDESYLNFGELDVAGVDARLSVKVQTSYGTWNPTLNLTATTRYQAAVTPGAPLTNRLSVAAIDAWAPRYKGNVALNWSYGPVSASLDGRYTSRYTDYQDFGPTNRQLGNFWIADLSARYAIGKTFAKSNRYLAGTYVQLGAVNLFNSLPPYSSFFYGYDPEQYDIRGRYIYTNIGIGW